MTSKLTQVEGLFTKIYPTIHYGTMEVMMKKIILNTLCTCIYLCISCPSCCRMNWMSVELDAERGRCSYTDISLQFIILPHWFSVPTVQKTISFNFFSLCFFNLKAKPSFCVISTIRIVPFGFIRCESEY